MFIIFYDHSSHNFFVWINIQSSLQVLKKEGTQTTILYLNLLDCKLIGLDLETSKKKMFPIKSILLIVLIFYLTVPFIPVLTNKTEAETTVAGTTGAAGKTTKKGGVGVILPLMRYEVYGCLWSLLGLFYAMK